MPDRLYLIQYTSPSRARGKYQQRFSPCSVAPWSAAVVHRRPAMHAIHTIHTADRVFDAPTAPRAAGLHACRGPQRLASALHQPVLGQLRSGTAVPESTHKWTSRHRSINRHRHHTYTFGQATWALQLQELYYFACNYMSGMCRWEVSINILIFTSRLLPRCRCAPPPPTHPSWTARCCCCGPSNHPSPMRARLSWRAPAHRWRSTHRRPGA